MSWSAWNKNKESQMTVGRQAAKGKVNMAKTIFESNSRKAQQAKAPTPKPAGSGTNKHNYKGLAGGSFVKRGNHWTIARKTSTAPPVKSGSEAPKPSMFAEVESFPEEQPRTSFRKSLRNSLRKSLQSVKSFVSEKSEEVVEEKSQGTLSYDHNDAHSDAGSEYSAEESHYDNDDAQSTMDRKTTMGRESVKKDKTLDRSRAGSAFSDSDVSEDEW